MIFSFLTCNLSRNSESITHLFNKIDSCNQQLQILKNIITEQIPTEKYIKSFLQNEVKTQNNLQQLISTEEQKVEKNLILKIFGQKKYKYKLCLEEQQFPTQIYKQRNIKFKVSLKNQNGKPVKNANMINLCFSLVDDNGKWINTNRVGDPMIKGKTEVQMYHGESEFNKIYTKDISRTFLNGRVNILVYSKPSVLIYGGQTSQFEQYIQQNTIQPLLIQRIVIKAKKKY